MDGQATGPLASHVNFWWEMQLLELPLNRYALNILLATTWTVKARVGTEEGTGFH